MKKTISIVALASLLASPSGPMIPAAWAQSVAAQAVRAAAPVLGIGALGGVPGSACAAPLLAPAGLESGGLAGPLRPALSRLPRPVAPESAPAAAAVSRDIPSAVLPLHGSVSPSEPAPAHGAAVALRPAAASPAAAMGGSLSRPSPAASPEKGRILPAPAVGRVLPGRAAAQARPGRGEGLVGRLSRSLAEVGEGGRPRLPRTAAARLDLLFDGSGAAVSRPVSPLEAAGMEGEYRPSRPAGLSPALSGNDRQGRSGTEPARVQQPPAPRAPRASLARSWRVGAAAAVVPLLLNVVVPMAAAAAGYTFHSDYGSGAAAITLSSYADVARMGFSSVVMAPLSEEVLFRGLLMGGLAWLGGEACRRLGLQGRWKDALQVWLPAVVSSLVFVAVHETADPVMFGLRMVSALMLAGLFHHEGLYAAVAMHMVNNAVSSAEEIGSLLLGPEAGNALFWLALTLAAVLGWTAYQKLLEQRKDREEGRVAPLLLSPRAALGLAAFCLAAVPAGFLALHQAMWGGAAVLLALYALFRPARWC